MGKKAGLMENLSIDLSCPKEWGPYTCEGSLGKLVLRAECGGLRNATWLQSGSLLQGRGVDLGANPRVPPASRGGAASCDPARLRAWDEPDALAGGGPGAEQALAAAAASERRAGSAELESRWDTCGSWGSGASGGCSCVPRNPAQVTHSGRRGGTQEKSI